MRRRGSFQFSGLCIVGLLVTTFLGGCAGVVGDLVVETRIDNDSVFPDSTADLYLAVGDLTNDGAMDVVVSKGFEAGAAVFQRAGDGWDGGTLLEGPSLTVAARPMVAPIRNDGNLWLVYTEHLGGNNGQWLRAHRYEGTRLAESLDVATRAGEPGHQGSWYADVDGDGDLEVWYVELNGRIVHDDGTFEPALLRLYRAAWNAASGAYDITPIAAGVSPSEIKRRPINGDFFASGGESLVWLSGDQRLELVSYTPGEGSGDHTSEAIFESPGRIVYYYGGTFDAEPGDDIAVISFDNPGYSVHLISGSSFASQTLVEGVEESLQVVVLADLDGDGADEVIVAGAAGGLYAFDAKNSWRMIESYTDTSWLDGAAVRWEGAERDEALFLGTLSDTETGLRVIAVRSR